MSRTQSSVFARGLIVAAALALAAPAAAWADPPGYDFMMFPERMALVVDPASISGLGKTPKGIISEDAAAQLVAGAQPLSRKSIVLLYHGKIYIVPDKRLDNGTMASEAVKGSGSSAAQ